MKFCAAAGFEEGVLETWQRFAVETPVLFLRCRTFSNCRLGNMLERDHTSSEFLLFLRRISSPERTILNDRGAPNASKTEQAETQLEAVDSSICKLARHGGLKRN